MKDRMRIEEINKVMDKISEREPSLEQIDELLDILNEDNVKDDKKIAKNKDDNGVEQARV